MKFGIFDHLDQKDAPLQQLYQERLDLLAFADTLGFHAYHLAEHHATPLGAAPSPSVFLAAVAQRTKVMRIGSLVHVLPLYHPLRLIEEICMLDHLSGGRLEIGVGRGISPYEVGYYGRNFTEAPDIFRETLGLLLKGLASERLSHKGDWYRFFNVPMEMRPLQRPHPPLWYGVGSRDSLDFAAQFGMNAVATGSTARLRETVALYREAWERHKDHPNRQSSPVRTPFIGARRHVFIADSDAEAEQLARPAYQYWARSFVKLFLANQQRPLTLIEDFDEARKAGVLVTGGPAAVRAALQHQAEETGCNYLVLATAWGSLEHGALRRSLELLGREVMPHFG